MSAHTNKQKVLAIASKGGHWKQLLRLYPAYSGPDIEITFISTCDDLGEEVKEHLFRTVIDANRWNRFRLVLMLFQIAKLILTIRPNVIITTGAAPGLFAVIAGKLTGTKTIWIDSIANFNKVSLSGRIAHFFATFSLTQWKHLSKPQGPHFIGDVL